MKEIKFRAWDKVGYTIYNPERFIQKMYYDVQNTYDNCEGDDKPGHRSFGELLKDDRFVIMQFTGFCDKNGKEIYEGDIVDMYASIDKDKKKCIGQIVFEKGQFCIKWFNKNSDGWGKGIIESWIEIIGNIYENPELLKNG